MIAQAQSNYGLKKGVVNVKTDKSIGIFIKDIVPKVQKAMKEPKPLVVKIKDQNNKKWEAKKDVAVKKKEESHPIKVVGPNIDKIVEDSSLQTSESKGTNLDLQFSTPVDMFTMLSKMLVKVPLLEIFRIEEHKNKLMVQGIMLM